MAALAVLLVYFGIGAIALGTLDLITGRVRGNLRDASYDSQSVLTKAGIPVSARAALVITISVMLLLWPATIYGAVSDLLKKGGKK